MDELKIEPIPPTPRVEPSIEQIEQDIRLFGCFITETIGDQVKRIDPREFFTWAD